MYIPVSFFGGNNCTGSGVCYSYGNTSTSSADAITYTSLCGVSSYPLSISPNRVEKFAAISGSVGGLAATTKLAGQPYTVSSSCNLLQPTIYTLTKSGGTSGIDGYYHQQSFDSNPSITFVGSGVPIGGTMQILSMFPPQLTYRTLAGGGFTTITSSSPSGSPVLDTYGWNDGTVRLWRLPMMSGSFSVNTSLYGKPIIRDVVIPLKLNNSPGLVYEMLSETTPYIQYTTPIANRQYLGWNYSPTPGGTQTVSSSCWNYSIYNPDVPSVTINYVDCNNTSASIIVGSGLTETVCARYNSIVFPSLPAGADLVIELASTCFVSTPLPSGSIPVSQSIASAIDLNYSTYSTASLQISDLSGNNNYFSNQSYTSWSLATTSSVSGNIFKSQNTASAALINIVNNSIIDSGKTTLLFSWYANDMEDLNNTPGFPVSQAPLMFNPDIDPGNNEFGFFGNGQTGVVSGSYGFVAGGPNTATFIEPTLLGKWHISQISYDNTTLSGSYCFDGTTGSYGVTYTAGGLPIQIFGQSLQASTFRGDVQWQIAAVYTSSLSTDQMVTNWNSLKGRYGY